MADLARRCRAPFTTVLARHGSIIAATGQSCVIDACAHRNAWMAS